MTENVVPAANNYQLNVDGNESANAQPRAFCGARSTPEQSGLACNSAVRRACVTGMLLMLGALLGTLLTEGCYFAMDTTPVGMAAARCAAQTTRMHDEVVSELAKQSADVVTLRNEGLLLRTLLEKALLRQQQQQQQQQCTCQPVDVAPGDSTGRPHEQL